MCHLCQREGKRAFGGGQVPVPEHTGLAHILLFTLTVPVPAWLVQLQDVAFQRYQYLP